MAKDTNSRHTSRNNKQEIFSRITKSAKLKTEAEKKGVDVDKACVDKPSS